MLAVENSSSMGHEAIPVSREVGAPRQALLRTLRACATLLARAPARALTSTPTCGSIRGQTQGLDPLIFKHLRSPEVCVNGETCEREIAWYAIRSRSGHRGTSTAEERRLHQTAAEMVDHGTAVQAKWAAQHFADLSEHGPSPALVARTCSLDLELCLSCLLCRTPSARIMRVVQSLMMLRNEFAVALSLEGALRRSSARRGRALTRSTSSVAAESTTAFLRASHGIFRMTALTIPKNLRAKSITKASQKPSCVRPVGEFGAKSYSGCVPGLAGVMWACPLGLSTRSC